MNHRKLILLFTLILILFISSTPETSGQIATPIAAGSGQYAFEGGRAMSFSMKSTAFANGGEIATKFTCEGADHSPALSWDHLPAGTQTLALIADDLDAPGGTWTHWLIWNIPAKTTSLPEGLPRTEVLDNGARQGKNDFKRIGYGGPCPPPGKPHRYFFKLYALNATLDVKAGASKKELEQAMKPHILSRAELMGTYRR